MNRHLFFFYLLFCTIQVAHSQCTSWFSPSPTTAWTDFGAVPCTGESKEITAFEVYKSEAFQLMGIIEGAVYTFGICNGPGSNSWVADFTIITPSGAIDNFGGGDGCSITWTASETGTYLVLVNEEGNCGVDGEVDNGFPMITTVSGGLNCLPLPVFLEGAESFESGALPECWKVVDADEDGRNWAVTSTAAYDGTHSIRSDSYNESTELGLTPDNFLISPRLVLGEGDSLYYIVASFSTTFPAENYSVLISTTGSEVEDFTDLVFTEILTSTEWEGRSVDLTTYNNDSIYIAFRHHDVTDQWAILLDAIALPGEVICETVSVRNLTTVKAQLYPNPARRQVNINSPMVGNAQINISDASGRIVSQTNAFLNGQMFTFDISRLENGFYTLQMKTADQVAVQKFLKQ